MKRVLISISVIFNIIALCVLIYAVTPKTFYGKQYDPEKDFGRVNAENTKDQVGVK